MNLTEYGGQLTAASSHTLMYIIVQIYEQEETICEHNHSLPQSN